MKTALLLLNGTMNMQMFFVSQFFFQKLPLINDIRNKLILLVDRNTVNCDNINDVSDEICNIFVMSASEAFGKKVAVNTCNNKISFIKPWFTKHCKSVRQNYRI
jgi:hypothetical protein